MKGEGELKRKAKVRQRKQNISEVIRPIHADCNEAFRKLIDQDMELIENENDSVNHEHEDNDENSELSDAISVTDD